MKKKLFSLSECVDNLGRVGESVLAQKTSEESYGTFPDQKLTVDDNVELSRATGLQSRLETKLFFDSSRETRGFWLISSAYAVKNDDVHPGEFEWALCTPPLLGPKEEGVEGSDRNSL